MNKKIFQFTCDKCGLSWKDTDSKAKNHVGNTVTVSDDAKSGDVCPFCKTDDVVITLTVINK